MIFSEEDSEHVTAFRMKTKDVAAELMKRYVKWSERQTNRKLKKIVPDGGKEYLKGCASLVADGI